VAPRAVLHLPVGTTLFCLGSDDNSAILKRASSVVVDGEELDRNTLDLVEIPSLRLIKTLVENGQPLAIVDSSVDRRAMIWERFVDGHPQFLTVELPSGAMREIPLPDSGTTSFEGIRISPDGLFLSLPIWDNGSAVQIWDIPGRRVYSTVRGVHDPAIFSPDSRYLVARVEDGERNKVCAIDLQALTTRRTFVGPPNIDICSAAVSDQGHFLIAEFTMNDARPNRLLCWNMETGEPETAFYDPSTEQGTAVGAKMLIVHQAAWADSVMRCLEVSKPLSEALAQPWVLQVSPDGRVGLLATYIPERPLQAWLRKLRITNPFGDYDFGATFFDLKSGQQGAFVPVSSRAPNKPALSIAAEWSGTGNTLAIYGRGEPESACIYDIPPRKSLTWFAAGAALVALPIAFVAWRRSRKLTTMS
jgi:hypothetical protein